MFSFLYPKGESRPFLKGSSSHWKKSLLFSKMENNDKRHRKAPLGSVNKICIVLYCLPNFDIRVDFLATQGIKKTTKTEQSVLEPCNRFSRTNIQPILSKFLSAMSVKNWSYAFSFASVKLCVHLGS